MTTPPLTENEEAILLFIESSPTHKEICSEFDILAEKHINYALHVLESKKLIKDKFPIYVDVEEAYILTPLGKNYLAKTTKMTSFSNITNSNIANNSPHSTQLITVQEQPLDIQEKIKELELAILRKDSSAIKKTFGYIADKSVDVAIALATGSLLK